MLSSTDPGSGCLNRLDVEEGGLCSGELVDDGSGPEALFKLRVGGSCVNTMVRVDYPLENGALNIPGMHGLYEFVVKIPTIGGAITVKNQDSNKVIGNGSVYNICGARLGPPPSPIPTLPQYAIIALIMGLLFAAVRITRHRMSV